MCCRRLARSIEAIDTHDVLLIVEPLWQDKTETATRVLNRIGLIFDWATAKLRAGDTCPLERSPRRHFAEAVEGAKSGQPSGAALRPAA
jgi:hypothetical protein